MRAFWNRTGWALFYYGLVVLLCLPALGLFFAGLLALDAHMAARIGPVPSFDWDVLLVAAPGVVVEFAVLFGVAYWRERGQR